MADTFTEEERKRALRANRNVNDDIDLPSEMGDEDDEAGFFDFVDRFRQRLAEREQQRDIATGRVQTDAEGNVITPIGPREGEQPAEQIPVPEQPTLTPEQQKRRAEASADARNENLSRAEKNRRANERLAAAEEERRKARAALGF